MPGFGSSFGPKVSRRRVLSAAAGFAAAASLPRAARAQQPKLDRINIVNASGNLTTVVQEMLSQQGLLAKFGLTAEPVFVGDGAKIMGAVLSGEMDFCPLSGISQVFPAIEKGGNLKLVNTSVRLGQQTIFTRDPAVKTIKDLKGKIIGIGSLGAQLHQVTVALLLKNGVDPSEVTFANVGTSADVFRAMIAKTIDAGSAQIDVIPEAEKVGLHRVQGGDMWTDLKEFPFQGGFSTDRAMSEKRDIMVRTLAAYATLFRFLSGPNSRDAFREARRKALTKSGAEFDASSDFQWEFMQKTQPFALDLILPPDGVEYIQDLNVRLGVQKAKMPYERVADMSLARDAVKLV